MDHKTCESIVIVPAADGTDPQSQSQSLAPQALHNVLTQVVLAFSRAAAVALATCIFAVTAWRARREAEDLAFVAGAYAALAALLLCLRHAGSLTPDATPAERRRLHAAVWALSTALSCAFACRVSLLMPAALVAVIWCMTSFVVLLGFYMLVLCKDQLYRSVDDVDCDAAGDRKPLIKKITPNDEIV